MVTAGSIAKFGAAIGAGAVVALGMLGSGRHAEAQSSPSSPAYPAISAPALTAADIAGVRDEVRQLRADTLKDIESVRDDLREFRKELREARRIR